MVFAVVVPEELEGVVLNILGAAAGGGAEFEGVEVFDRLLNNEGVAPGVPVFEDVLVPENKLAPGVAVFEGAPIPENKLAPDVLAAVEFADAGFADGIVVELVAGTEVLVFKPANMLGVVPGIEAGGMPNGFPGPVPNKEVWLDPAADEG